MLHFLVGLADQAEDCLKVWENILYNGQNIGSLAHRGYYNGESGTLRLFRSVCKPVHYRGCEKSGKMATFEIFTEEQDICRLPIYQFLGNRFNVVFLNGACIYYLFDYAVDFFIKIELDNKLLLAVHWEWAYKVGCRALGLIEKQITGPLWRIMEKEKCVLNMSKHCQDLLFYFEKWAEDCSSFLMNNETFCDRSFISEDICFDSLNVQASDEEQKMVKQCLEIIFGGFVVVSRRMLHSHLKEGVFSTITEELKKEASSARTTNAAAERKFAMLDRLKRSKPRALDIVYEGMTMFSLKKQIAGGMGGAKMYCIRSWNLQENLSNIKSLCIFKAKKIYS